MREAGFLHPAVKRATRWFRYLVAALLVLSIGLASVAAADFEDSDATNQQEGDNEAAAEQGGSASSGDAVGGQVAGIVSSGEASLDARNRSEDVQVRTGTANASNDADSFTGLAVPRPSEADRIVDTTFVNADDFTSSDAFNQQDGDNALDLTQTADASTGDGVGGQVIGVVTSAGGSADVVADNASEDVDIETGNADATNGIEAFVGLNVQTRTLFFGAPDLSLVDADFTGSNAFNQQDGDNALDADQNANAASGDGVGGQVIGVVSAGDASVDARNRSEDVDIETGNATADNFSDTFTGLDYFALSEVQVFLGDFTDSGAKNQQDGDNALDLTQTADASTGDGVGGQVIGVVTSAGGSADVVADNASEDVDIETGNADATNGIEAFVGQRVDERNLFNLIVIFDDFEGSVALNQQDGDNSLDADQSATASSGDGVGGQVLGLVSAGDASIDARNRSEDVDVETGNAIANNDADVFVGLDVSSTTVTNFFFADFEGSDALNQQDGDNDSSVAQSADADSGDAVAGQVAGGVVGASGSLDAVLDNASEDVDVTTGEARHENRLIQTVGLVARKVAEVFGGCDI